MPLRQVGASLLANTASYTCAGMLQVKGYAINLMDSVLFYNVILN